MEESCRISGRRARLRTSALLAAAGAGRGRGSHAEWQIWATVPAPAGLHHAGDLPLLLSPPAGCEGVGLGRAFVPHCAPGLGCCCLPSLCSTCPSAASILPQHPSFPSTQLSPAPLHPQHLSIPSTSFPSTHPAAPSCPQHTDSQCPRRDQGWFSSLPSSLNNNGVHRKGNPKPWRPRGPSLHLSLCGSAHRSPLQSNNSARVAESGSGTLDTMCFASPFTLLIAALTVNKPAGLPSNPRRAGSGVQGEPSQPGPSG